MVLGLGFWLSSCCLQTPCLGPSRSCSTCPCCPSSRALPEVRKFHRSMRTACSSPLHLLGSDPRMMRGSVWLRLRVGDSGRVDCGGRGGVEIKPPGHAGQRPTGPSPTHPTLLQLHCSRRRLAGALDSRAGMLRVLLLARRLLRHSRKHMDLAKGVFNYSGLCQHPPSTLN